MPKKKKPVTKLSYRMQLSGAVCSSRSAGCFFTDQPHAWSQDAHPSTRVKGHELSKPETRPRAGTAQPADEKAQGGLISVYKYLKGGTKKTEPDCFWWCPLTGPEAMGTQ